GEGLHQDAGVLARYAPDLARDPVHVALSRWHWTSNVIVGLGLLAFGGIPYVLWGIFFRTTVGLHATWLVNSATHKWGSRRFQTRDDSTNNWWVALLTFGEGWHNNHHAHPTSARHGLAWYELDPNWMGIRTLQALGLAWDIKLPRSGATSLSGGLRPPDPLARSLAGAPDAPLRSRGFARSARSRMRR
ncbi:MAG: fatty acid desaturase, partial [Acidobacteria bacterium]|nr:fatty acid desaturase [Acidobacteriota bacterium]